MSNKKLNLVTDFYFYLILFSGILYLSLLLIAFEKIFPGFIMQIIFLFDALKFDSNITSLILSRLFLINIISGVILIGLSVRLIKVLFQAAKNYFLTTDFTNKLRAIKTSKGYYKFHSNNNLIFTLGFLKPNIYVSTSLFKHHGKEEIEAMIWHEENHQIHHHPLKVLIANIIKSFLPYIPKKDWLIENFITLVEVSSDRFAESKISNRSPLVSALLKFQMPTQNTHYNGINYFNGQSERIKILVGQKKQFIRLPMAYYSFVLIMFISGALFIKNSNIFFNCNHLLKCVEILINPHSESLSVSVNSSKSNFTPSDHCQ